MGINETKGSLDNSKEKINKEYSGRSSFRVIKNKLTFNNYRSLWVSERKQDKTNNKLKGTR